MTTKIPAELSSTPGIADSSNATAITISSSEQVMIGTTDAGYPDYGDSLTVADVDGGGGNAGMTIRSGTSSYGTFYFSDATGTAAGAYAGKIQYNHSNNSMVFGTNSSDKLTIDSSGKVGIGTTSPDVLLDVRGEVSIAYNASHGLRFYNQGRSNWASIGNRDTSTGADLQFKTGSATALTLSHEGNFTHMGTAAFTTGTTALRKRTLSSKDFAELSMGGEYATNDTLVVYDTTNSVTRFKVNYQGTVYATSTTISSLSDERLKENITDLDKGLADILKLKPRRFDWKAEEGSGKTGVTGFIAQECEEAGFEEFVDTVDFSETIKNVKTFGYGGLIPALVKPIQEQQDIIKDLKSRIETLEG